MQSIHFTNHQQHFLGHKNVCSHFLTAARANFLMLYSGYVAAFIIADKSLPLSYKMSYNTKILYYFSQRTLWLRNESKNL